MIAKSRALYLALAVAVLSSSACAVQSDAGDDELTELAADADALQKIGSLPKPADPNQQLYFTGRNWAHPSLSGGPDRWVFAARGGHAFSITATALNGDGETFGIGMGAKLYYLSSSGSWRAWRKAQGEGAVSLSVTPTYASWLMLELTTKGEPESVSVELDCADKGCILLPEPGAKCGGLAGKTCGAGLYCEYGTPAGASCGGGDRTGVCTRRKASCPAPVDTKTGAPLPVWVCGCDGKTYESSCAASAAGAGVARDGGCDLCALTPTTIKSAAAVAGTYVTNDLRFRYVLRSTGAFEVTYDACAGAAGCKIEKVVKKGKFTIDRIANQLELQYDDFGKSYPKLQLDCHGTAVLDVWDWSGLSNIPITSSGRSYVHVLAPER